MNLFLAVELTKQADKEDKRVAYTVNYGSVS